MTLRDSLDQRAEPTGDTEPSETTLQKADSLDTDPGLSELDLELHDYVPNYFYVTHVTDHSLHEDNSELSIALQGWNATLKSTFVRVQAFEYDGTVHEYDTTIEAGKCGNLLHGPFYYGLPQNAEWFVVASDRPLIVVGDTYFDKRLSNFVNDGAVGQAWAGKRTLDVREVDCVRAAWICQAVVATTPWPVE